MLLIERFVREVDCANRGLAVLQIPISLWQKRRKTETCFGRWLAYLKDIPLKVEDLVATWGIWYRHIDLRKMEFVN